jgi:hypothetical protein
MAKYRVLKGIDYPPNKRAEAGAIVEDLPATAIKWLLEDGIIEDANKKATVVEEPVAVVEPVKEEPIVEAPVVEAPVEVVEEGFDPDAKDIDGDGFLQDGTPFQRPVEEK